MKAKNDKQTTPAAAPAAPTTAKRGDTVFYHFQHTPEGGGEPVMRSRPAIVVDVDATDVNKLELAVLFSKNDNLVAPETRKEGAPIGAEWRFDVMRGPSDNPPPAGTWSLSADGRY